MKEEGTHINIKPPDETGEIVVLEILGKKTQGELSHVPYDKTIIVFAPGYERIGGRP